MLLVGLVMAYVVGATFPAQVVKFGSAEFTTYTVSVQGGANAFNWLFAMLVAGPAVIASAVLYGCAEIVGGLRRSSRTRSSEGSGGHDAAGAS